MKLKGYTRKSLRLDITNYKESTEDLDEGGSNNLSQEIE